MKRFLFVFTLVIFCINTNLAQQTSAENLFEFKGFVKNQDKIPLAGLDLFFESNETKTKNITDENGVFIAKLPIGKYKISVNSAVSKNFTAFIEIFDNNLNPKDFELTIETEKLCCSQIANGKPTEVTKYFAPKFPPAARAVRTAGEVVITVKIDKEGNVISAIVESGHPLLRAESLVAAKQWLFSADETTEEREGKIIFAFIQPGKKVENIFTKPNRLEIYAQPPTIDY